MRIFGAPSVTLPSGDVDASRQWWSDTLGLTANEDDETALDVGEITLRFGTTAAMQLVGDVETPQQLTDPSGTAVEVVPPDRDAGRRAEDSIGEFVRSAESLPGPSVDALADDVLAEVVAARDRIAAVLSGVPHNKVLATQLALGQRARAFVTMAPPPEEQWPLHAASTLMSGFIIAGGGSG